MKSPRKKFLWLALVVSLNFASASRVVADGVYHFIAGYVRDQAGNPIVGLDVLGDNFVGDDLDSQPTDSTGYYLIDAGTEGNYRVTVSCAQLSAQGFLCVAPITVSVAAEYTEVDITVTSGAAPLQITNSFLPRGNVGMAYGVQLAAAGGQAPYRWQLADSSAPLPGGLLLSSSGFISGTPATNAQAAITVQVTDANSVVTNRLVALVINPRPVLSALTWKSNQFQLRLTGASSQNYTLQSSPSLNSTNWTTLLVTNHPSASSFLVAVPEGSNTQRFYRVLIGP